MAWVNVAGIAGSVIMSGMNDSGGGASQGYVPGGNWNGGQAYLPPGYSQQSQSQPQSQGSPVDPYAGYSSSGGFTGGGGSSPFSGGGANGALSSQYATPGLATADLGFQSNFNQQQQNNYGAQNTAAPLYAQTLAAQQGINYQPYQQAANAAGQQYGQAATAIGQQGALATQQQQNLYGAGNQLYQTSLDPQNALYNRTQGQLSDQVNAGQAARGLGVSPVGGSEYNQAMSNFNIDWQNQQLQRQATGLQGMASASNAGGAQGQLANADYAAMPGYTQQAAGIPLAAQQMIAGMPAQSATAYSQGLSGLNQNFYNTNAQAQQYMGQGVNAAQFQQQQATANNAAVGNLGSQLGQGLATSYNTPGSWLNNAFSGPQSSGGSIGNFGYSTDYGGTGGLNNSFGNTGYL